jgi:hypothetical protein
LEVKVLGRKGCKCKDWVVALYREKQVEDTSI